MSRLSSKYFPVNNNNAQKNYRASEEVLAARVEYDEQKLEARRAYNLAHDHAHKKPNQHDVCEVMLSSTSALRRHGEMGCTVSW